MKKIAAIVLALGLSLAAVGCGTNIATGNTGNSTADSTGTTTTTTDEAAMGDVVTTAFFKMTVTGATVADTFEDVTPSDGNKLVVVDLTIENTEDYDMPMLEDDFQIQWGTGDEDYGYPVAGDMCTSFEIPVGESQSGQLVFDVPADTTDFELAFQEYYEDESTGDAYFISFTAE